MGIINFRHLGSSIRNFDADGLGNCFQRSVALVMDWPVAKLVIGTMTHDEGDYLHCWVQASDVDYDPSRFEDHGELLAFDRDVYRTSHKARDVHVIPRKFVMDFAKEGGLSAWMLKRDVPDHRFDGVMGEVLLQRLGIPFRVGDDGGLFPA